MLYKAYANGCQHRFTNPAEAKALPHEGASVLVRLLRLVLSPKEKSQGFAGLELTIQR